MSSSPNGNQSGGTRYNQDKPGGWWYGPLYGLILVAPVWEYGAEKYAPLDWLEGQDFSVLWDCLWRHLLRAQVHGLWSRDEESGCLHLAHAAWNLLALLSFMALRRDDLDDISPWRGVTAEESDG